MIKSIFPLVIILLVLSNLISQVPTPAKDQNTPIALKGGIAHLGNGDVISNSFIGFDKGKLTFVSNANDVKNSPGYNIIDVTGKHIYPGFILPNTQLGLVEVSSVRAMSDNSELGSINPNVRSVISYNTDSEMIPTMRFNGILLAESTPTSGVISGCSSVMEMEGWNWEDACHTVDVGIHLNWPAQMSREFDRETFTVNTIPNKNYKKILAELKTHFQDAKTYNDLDSKEINLKLQSMQGIFDGTQTLFIHASTAKEMVESIKFAQAHKVPKIVLIGGADALYIASFLKEHKIPVILPPTHSLPNTPDQVIDLPYQLPHLLTQAGISVSLSHSGMLANARNLPFYAGTAVAYGMDKEAALMTITANPAKALGIYDKVGSLEVGKDATLFVSEGDALDISTNQLTHAFIGGKMVILPNRQQELYERYSRKYGHIE